MQRPSTFCVFCRIGNGKLYEKIKAGIVADCSGKNNPMFGDHRFAGSNNPFFGKTHTKETWDKIAAINKIKNGGENNPMYGKTHTPEAKIKISNRFSKPVTVVLNSGDVMHFRQKNEIGGHFGVCKAMGVQLCSIKKHLWNKYGIKEIIE
jgi:hypothetical protein